MAYISPNSTVKILRNVPLSIDNEHSIAFASKAEQETYFNSKAKYALSQYSYIREGVLRVEKCADDIYDCNYLMFQNSAYGNKIFYAFITGIIWINNITAEITYTIDYLQTWLFDYTYKPCYIKRTHKATDEFGESLTPEPFNIDDYLYKSYGTIDVNLQPLAVIIGISTVQSGQVSGNLYEGIYGGATLYAFENSDVTGINNFLTTYKNTPDEVVFMYLCPKVMVEAIPNFAYGQPIPIYQNGFSITSNLNPLTFDDLDGYTPKNKKLYTYPYNFLQIDNGSQETLTLRYEFFEDITNIQAVIDGTFQTSPEAIFTPSRYRNNQVLSNSTDVLTMNDYPMLSWNNDTFKTWLSVNKIALIKDVVNAGINVAQGALQISTSNAMANLGMNMATDAETIINIGEKARMNARNTKIGTAFQAVNDILSITDKVYQASKQADQLKGNVLSSSALISMGRKQYHQARICVRYEQAKIIDDFFSMYGYSIEQIGVPNRTNRPYWTFIQTGGCIVTGNIPTDAKAYIQNRHNAGITWWTSGDVLGNYELDNSPSSNS